MSLRYRVVVAVVLVLMFGSGAGFALAGWQARQWLRGELTSAEASGQLAVAHGLSNLRRPQTMGREPPNGDLKTLVRTFDGDRHIQAVLINARGTVLAQSIPEPAAPPPVWFAALLHEHIAPVRLPGPDGVMVELRPVYANDTAAVWPEFLDLAVVLAFSCLGAAMLVWIVVGRALEPLNAVGEVLPRIGAGDYDARAPERGPPELEGLARGVNEMAAQLDAMRGRNRMLEEHILTLQEEERADIARDLHDEIGPHLFTAGLDLKVASGHIAGGRSGPALEYVGAVQEAITHMQRLVRDILQRLRPPRLLELGLAAAVRDLVEFWSQRRSETTFDIRLPSDDFIASNQVMETAYRLVQEGLSNAVRHSQPTRIAVVLEQRDAVLWVEVRNDGASADAARPGFGLTGMIERVASTGGVLEIGPDGPGDWTVVARIPLEPPIGLAAA